MVETALALANGGIDRAKAILTSVVTWITTAVIAITAVMGATDIPVLDNYGSQAVVALLGLVAIIQRVSPAPASDRGSVVSKA